MLREIQQGDIPLCGELYAKAFPKEYWGVDWSAERACEYLQDYMEQKRFVGYVYEKAESVQGAIFACGKISGCREEIYINEMMVLPDMQGKGIGKILLNAIKSYSEQHGFAGVVLYTSEYAPAMKFYEKNGFQISKGVVCMFSQHEA